MSNKKIFTILVITIILSVFTGCNNIALTDSESNLDHDTPAVASATANPESDFHYVIEQDEVTITGYKGTAADVVIPGKIEGKQVTTIDSEAFIDVDWITSVIIPEGVTSIGGYAFHFCTSLISITIPDSVTNIDDFAFRYCTSLESVTIPSGVTNISDGTFYHCDSLTTIVIPDGVTNIGNAAISDCTSLTSITIPESVTSIDDWAFSNSTSLEDINIPDNITYIGTAAFVDCDLLPEDIKEKILQINPRAFTDPILDDDYE